MFIVCNSYVNCYWLFLIFIDNVNFFIGLYRLYDNSVDIKGIWRLIQDGYEDVCICMFGMIKIYNICLIII